MTAACDHQWQITGSVSSRGLPAIPIETCVRCGVTRGAPRKLMPDDITLDELSWLLDNHPMFHRFVDELIANAIATWQQHHRWEKT